MSPLPWTIDPDIRRASTLPVEIYGDPRWYAAMRDRVFGRSWQLVADVDAVRVPGATHPFTLLEGMLDEPMVCSPGTPRTDCTASRTSAPIAALSSASTERSCRRFAPDGRFLSMPELEGAEGFPSPADDLPKIPFGTWGKLLFASLDPAFPLEELTAEMDARVSWLPLHEAVLDPSRSRDYLVKANWALYCDNYLEGFHIPYIHAGLAGALDYGEYRTEVFRWSNLQVGVASGGEDVFDLPSSSPDYDLQKAGKKIAGYYFWLFPNTMLNVYPWGISVNIVRPLAPDRTRVSFLSYVWDPARLEGGAGAALDRVEREDEAVVESVQRGVRSHLYHRGRYSPTREQGVHHFHRLLEGFLSES
jgi:choline monooxygenase